MKHFFKNSLKAETKYKKKTRNFTNVWKIEQPKDQRINRI